MSVQMIASFEAPYRRIKLVSEVGEHLSESTRRMSSIAKSLSYLLGIDEVFFYEFGDTTIDCHTLQLSTPGYLLEKGSSMLDEISVYEDALYMKSESTEDI